MPNTLSTKEKFKKVESMIMKLNSLTKLGFQLSKSKEITSNGPAGESYELLFDNLNNRSIEFTFYPAINDKGDYIVVYIINNNTNSDFSVDSWLQRKDGTNQTNPFKLSSYTGEYSNQVEEFENFIDNLFCSPELRSILEGKQWVNIDFNWGNHK